jgi:uncharacterized protein YecT (DUF1311 family)
MKRMVLILALMLVPMAAQADEDGLVFSPKATEACLKGAGDMAAERLCIGASANACMEATPGGYSTYGMGGCISREVEYWDARLNAAYKQAMAEAKQADKDNGAGPNGPQSQAEALRAMQRAWIPYRDAACLWEYSKWGGGTGGGPASASCMMTLTGEQALVLEHSGMEY